MKNKFTQAPLPFQGQKRRFLTPFKKALKGFPQDGVYVDLFGGSGLLAHTVKAELPSAKVVWNDFDNFTERLSHIPETNMLLANLRVLLEGYPKKARIDDNTKFRVLQLVKAHEVEFGYLDYVTLSASLLFSGQYATNYKDFAARGMYARLRKSDYNANGYLNGVDRVCMDYKKLYAAHQGAPSVVYLVDPPYLSTDVSTYNSADYWKLRDYLDVLNVLEGSDYFYFTSNKSQIVELCEWFETRTFTGNPFANATMSTTSNSINTSSSYTDIMLYKYNGS